LFHLYFRENAPSSFFSSIDVITIDQLSNIAVGRTRIELDADIINFIATRQTDGNFGVLFLLHQTNVTLVMKLFRSKGNELSNWFDRAIRITKLCSFITGFIGPVILNLYPTNSISYKEFLPLYFPLSYIVSFILWYKFAPKIILRLIIRIIIRKIME
jgi:hypothetical protein